MTSKQRTKEIEDSLALSRNIDEHKKKERQREIR